MKKLIFYSVIFVYLSLLIGVPTTKALSDIGTLCASNGDCASGDCEESTKTDQDKTLSYCDCDDEQDCVDFYGDTKENWICKDGANSTWDLDYCLNQDVEKTQFPIPTKKTGSISEIVADLLLDSSAVTTQLYSEIDNIVKKPQPKITIPGLSFSEGKTVEEPGGSYLYIPFLGEYIGAIYKYLVIIASIIAVAMIIKNAFDWAISAGEATKITQAKTRIGQALMGLVIAVGSYFILYTINPYLVEFKNLRVRYVERIELDNEDVLIPGESSGTTNVVNGVAVGGTEIEALIGALPNNYQPCSKEAALYTAQKLYEATVCVGACHCAWTASRFLKYIGCSNIIEGTAGSLGVALEKSGWATMEITPTNNKNLPVGLLFKNTHVGVSLGDGLQFQSGGTSGWNSLNKRGGGNCPKEQKDAVNNPSLCNFCSKIITEAPSSKRFMSAGESCKTNQAWDKSPIWPAYWKVVIYPTNSPTAKITCCFKAGGKDFKENTSATLCKFLTDGKQCN